MAFSPKLLQQGAAGGLAKNYIEDVFSTTLYDGNSSTQTITNGIDLSTKGGLVWIKSRSTATDNALFDTARGASNGFLRSNTTDTPYASPSSDLTSFGASGFSLSNTTGNVNVSSRTYVSWTFRKQPKFFDVQTFTYPSSGSITVPHNLASTPGCVMVKVTDGVDGWYVYHRMANNGTNPSNYILQLNTTGAQINNFASWITVGSSSITFPSGALNPGSNFVMYLFAHDAGGFGLTGTDNVISCGSFTPDGGGSATVTLGWEPQWVLVKVAGTTGNWTLIDTMRNYSLGGNSSGTNQYLRANTTAAELQAGTGNPTATGFFIDGVVAASQPHIYIAIRRGPMKVPTVGTSVFASTLITATQSTQNVTSVGFSPDLIINGVRSNANYGQQVTDRLRGVTKQVFTEYDSSEGTTNGTALVSLDMTGFTLGADTAGTGWNAYSGYTSVKWSFKRTPSYFDIVCYTGDGVSGRNITHNLTVSPELVIIKSRNRIDDWVVRSSAFPTHGVNGIAYLNLTGAATNAGYSYVPTTTTFQVESNNNQNGSSYTYVAYLFATCAGVSKVGSYTGTGTTLQIDCGFTGGARFVLIKRTDSTGDWYVWDSARGIVAGNDPYLLLNSAAAEVTGTDYVDTYAAGFELSSTAPAAINNSGGTFIFLAIA